DQSAPTEPVITKSGHHRIVADLAGMGAEDARRLIGATAMLEFKLVAEPEEIRATLNRVDAFLASRQQKAGGAAPTQAARGRTAVEDVFGRVVSDTASLDSLLAQDVATDDSALADSDPGAYPFSAYLLPVG